MNTCCLLLGFFLLWLFFGWFVLVCGFFFGLIYEIFRIISRFDCQILISPEICNNF